MGLKKIESLPEFQLDLKHLLKKYRTLEEDLKSFINTQLKIFHEYKIDNKGIERISNLGVEHPGIYKARKFACKSLKGRGCQSGIRIIYAYFPDLEKITFIEIYFKGDQTKENRDRITEFLKPYE